MKDRRLQIRVTIAELEGINRRAHAAGLTVAEYGRKVLLAGDSSALIEQESLKFEDPGLSVEEILMPEDPQQVAEVRQILEDSGHDTSGFDWKPCTVKDVPSGVRCFNCGRIHGS